MVYGKGPKIPCNTIISSAAGDVNFSLSAASNAASRCIDTGSILGVSTICEYALGYHVDRSLVLCFWHVNFLPLAWLVTVVRFYKMLSVGVPIPNVVRP